MTETEWPDDWPLRAIEHIERAEERAQRAEREVAELREALADMLSGWHYIRQVHGDLYGVGWDRAQQKAEKALGVALMVREQSHAQGGSE